MSYDFFVIKFENGKESVMDFHQLQSILANYGKLVGQGDDWEFVSDDQLFDSAQLLGDEDNGFYGVSFHRPTADRKLAQLVFNLLAIPNSCFFGTDMEFLQARSEITSNLPDVFIQSFPDGAELIDDAFACWPLG